MRILYLGDTADSATSFHRGVALTRLGHTVDFFDPRLRLGLAKCHRLIRAFDTRTGFRRVQRYLQRLLIELDLNDYDVIWIDSVELFGRKCLHSLVSSQIPIVSYVIDDPLGGRDGRRFDMFKSAISSYSLSAVVRECNVDEFIYHGSQRVLRIWRSYDEKKHAPVHELESVPAEYRSEVAFIGTWMRGEKRDEFLLRLIDQGVPVSIWGSAWRKSPHWRRLASHLRSDRIEGDAYRWGIRGAKINLGFLSKGNRDLHTTRSLEIPAVGGLLCAERTSEHVALYREDSEAVFWDNPEECAAICKQLLADETRREQIRVAGMRRVRELGLGNEKVSQSILDAVFDADRPRTSQISVPLHRQ